MNKRLIGIFVLLAGACGDDSAALPSPDAAAADASPDAAACTADTVACIGDAIVTCGADGTATSSISCDLGCDGSTGAPRCNVLQPSNLASTTCDTAAATDLTVANGVTTIDTGSNCDSVVTQTGGPAICVRAFSTISIAQGAKLRAVGTRALALVATSTFTLDGTIDASADQPTASLGAVAGPGAPLADGAGGNGGNGTSDNSDVAGGGAGAGTAGAAGSNTVALGAGGAAGAATGNPTLSPLIAGSSGGRNGALTGSNRGAVGGLGGGGLQLVACKTLAIGATAVVDASGSGGAGGPGSTSLTASGAGGGGGSGGGVLIEAAVVSIAGIVAANAGAGGGGGLRGANGSTTGAAGSPGADGAPGTTAATGGDGPAESGAGGAGGALASAPVVGEVPATSTGAAGGGGGAAGRIRINVRAGTTALITGMISPAPSAGTVAVHPQP